MEITALLQAQWQRACSLLPAWEALLPQMQTLVDSHGDMPGWQAALASLPAPVDTDFSLADCIRIGTALDLQPPQQQQLQTALQQLHPWRKGPWCLFDVHIDSEWRSDWKWARLAPHIQPLAERLVLDVGGGNGYYGWRMLQAGARQVIGIDPTLLFLMQHLAICHYLPAPLQLRQALLPLRLEDLPVKPEGTFDTLFSMGVLSHRRDPHAHLRQLRQQLRPGGELVLETLVVRGTTPLHLDGNQRYARMRNIWLVPTSELLCQWVLAAGFSQARIIDVSPTRSNEQRSTAWMQFESLDQALDPQDPTRTLEGHPAPVRALLLAQ